MISWPELGTRVTVRYRRPPGSLPPLTDVVGRLLAIDPAVQVQTKTGAIAEFAPADVVALRVLTDTPVRTSEIRALEHAAAAGWPGVQQAWLDGWLLRAGHGVTLTANSAVPLDISSHVETIPAIVAWYAERDLIPRLAIADRLLRLPAGPTSERDERVLVRDVSAGEPDRAISLSPRPDDDWLRISQVPADVLTAVVDGEVVFGAHPDGPIARAAVTDAPDGTRWVGLSVLRAADDPSAARLCRALLSWGAQRGASRAYLRVHGTGADALGKSLDFRLHHHTRYFPATAFGGSPDNL